MCDDEASDKFGHLKKNAIYAYILLPYEVDLI